MEKVSTQQRPLEVYENKSIKIAKLEHFQLNLATIQSDQALFRSHFQCVKARGQWLLP